MASKFYIVFLLALSSLQLTAECSKILGIFHFPSKSHHILGSTLLKALAKKGHDVTMVSPFVDKNPGPNYRNIELTGVAQFKDKFTVAFTNASSKIMQTYYAFQFIPTVCRMIVHHPNIKKLVDSGEKYDVAIIFGGFFEPLLGVTDKLEAPVIAFSPMGANFFTAYHLRNPMPFSYVPHMTLPYTDKMNFWQRTVNTLTYVFTDLMNTLIVMPFVNKLYQEAFPNGKPLQELIDDVDLYLMNSHTSTETLRPYLPNMVQIGGFHLQGTEELSSDLKKYLDDATEGVIYISFGTNVDAKLFSSYQKDAIVNTLRKLKLKVLWKFEQDVENKPSNVRIEKWLPQKSILAHPNVKLFITHGGMGSLSETIYHGVPIVGMPFFGDQQSNIEESVKQGYGVKVNKDELTENNLFVAVNEVLNNKSYRENIQRRSILYREQPMNPMDKAIFWVEHVIKHEGAKHLRPQSKMLSFYEYYLLDVIAFLTVIAVFSIILAIYIAKLFYKCCIKVCCAKRKTKKILAKKVK